MEHTVTRNLSAAVAPHCLPTDTLAAGVFAMHRPLDWKGNPHAKIGVCYVERIIGDVADVRFDCNNGTRSRQYRVLVANLTPLSILHPWSR